MLEGYWVTAIAYPDPCQSAIDTWAARAISMAMGMIPLVYHAHKTWRSFIIEANWTLHGMDYYYDQISNTSPYKMRISLLGHIYSIKRAMSSVGRYCQ